jgi:hypothetical protein
MPRNRKAVFPLILLMLLTPLRKLKHAFLIYEEVLFVCSCEAQTPAHSLFCDSIYYPLFYVVLFCLLGHFHDTASWPPSYWCPFVRLSCNILADSMSECNVLYFHVCSIRVRLIDELYCVTSITSTLHYSK